jgi:hypothetical protein
MFDFFATFFASPVYPLAILFLACVVVIWEAVRSSRHALWGDMFADDGDD